MQFNPSVFKGEVVERVVERPREISQIKQNGLASPAPTWRGKSLGAACNPRSPPTVSQQQPLKPPFPESNNNADNNIGQPQTDTDPVMKQILQMSPDEVQAAQREIAAMFKPKNLEFLKKMALKKSATAMNDRDMNCELQPPQIKQSVTPTNPSSSSANIDVQPASRSSSGTTMTKSTGTVRKLMRSSTDRFDLRGCKVVQKESSIIEISAALQDNSLFKGWSLLKDETDVIARSIVEIMLDVGFAVEHMPLDDSQPQDELLNHQMDSDIPGYNMTEICEFYRCENPSQRLLGLNILLGVLRHRDHAVSLEAYCNYETLDPCQDLQSETRPGSEDDEAMREQDSKNVLLDDFETLQAAFERVVGITIRTVAGSISKRSSSPSSSSSSYQHWMKSLNQHHNMVKIRRLLVYVLLILCASDLPTGLPTLLVWGIKQPRLPPSIVLSTLRCLREYLSSGPEEIAAEALWDAFGGTTGCPSLPMAHTRRAETSYEEHIEDCFDNRRNVLEDEQKVLQDDEDSKGGKGQKEGDRNRAPMFETFALRCRWGRVDCLVSEGIVSVLCGHIVAGAAVMQYNQDTNLHATGSRSVDVDRDSDVRTEIEAEKERGRDSASVLALQSAFVAISILHSICRLCDKDQITSVILNIMRIWRQCLVLLDTDESGSDSKRGGLSCGWWKVIAEACRRSRDFAVWINGVQQQQESVVAKCLILLLRSAPVNSTLSVSVFGSTVDPLSQNLLKHTPVMFLRERDKLDSQRQCWDSAVWALRVWRICAAYGLGLVSVSELLIASQLPVCSTGVISKTNITADGTHISKNNSLRMDATDGVRDALGPHSYRDSSRLNSLIAQAIGPGLVSRISSSPRLTSVLLLLEQTAVSCAAVIDLHTVKVKGMGEHGEINGAQKKGVSFKTVSPIELEKETDEEEVVGLALETSRLLLGVAERLLSPSNATALSSSSSLLSSSPSLLMSSDSCLSSSDSLLKSASMHFVSSLLGIWQQDSLHYSSISTAGGEGERGGGINYHIDGRDDSGRSLDDISSVILEITNLRQHYRCTSTQKEKSRNDMKSASAKCVSVSRVGQGLLQSCLTYAVYVRESTMQYREEKDECVDDDIVDGKEPGNEQEKDIDTRLKNLDFASSAQETTINKQFQFAALHHLESKINAFIDSFVISPSMLLSLSHMLSVIELEEEEEGSSCAFSKWILCELFFSIQRLLSSVLSYTTSLNSIHSSPVPTSTSLLEGMVREEGGSKCLNMIQAVCTAAVDRTFRKKPVRHTPLVSEGLYAWQSSRVMECILLTDLRFISSFTSTFASAITLAGQAQLQGSYAGDVLIDSREVEGQEIDHSVLLSSCLICMRNLGQGFKRKIVLLTQLVLKMIDRLIISAKPLIDPLSQKLLVAGSHLDAVEGSSITPFSVIRKEKGKMGDDIDNGDEGNEWIQKNTISPGLKNKLLFLLLGSKEESDKRVCFSDFATILKPSSFNDQPDGSLMNMTDWKNDYHDSTVPLRMDWPVECLSGLTGENFERWLCVLSCLGKIPERGSSQSTAICRENSDSTYNVNTDRQPYSLLLSSGVDNLYGLLRLACPDQGHRWRTLTEEKEEEIPGGVEGDGDVCMTVGDSSELAVAAYCSLLIHSTSQIAKHQQIIRLRVTGSDNDVDSLPSIGHQRGDNSVCEQFIVAAQREVATTHALSVKKVKSVLPQGCVGSSFGFGVKAEGGVMELCGKLLEGLTSQTVSQELHCLSVLTLLSPYLSPWRVRERVWRELGELRLLHLLEDPSMIRSLLSLLDTSEFVFPLNSGTNHLPIDIKHISTVPIRTDFDTASRSGSNSDAPGHLSSINVSAGAADPLMNSRGASSNVKGNERQKQARNSTLVLVAKAIIETLSTLRSEGDRVWVVVSIGLYHISSSIFNISPANKFITVNESQHRLLTDLLQNQNVADWVVLGVLLAADAFASHGIEKEVQTDEMNRLGSENDIKEVQMRVTRNLEADLPIENIFPEYHRKRALLNDISSPTLATIPDYFCLILSRTVLPLSKGDSVSLKSLIKNTRPHLL